MDLGVCFFVCFFSSGFYSVCFCDVWMFYAMPLAVMSPKRLTGR